MKYDIIFSDYDNTLYGKSGKISEKTKAGIQKFVENGGKFVISTGRIYDSVRPIAQSLGLTDDLISSQGSAIYNLATDKAIFTYTMIKDKAIQIVEYALNNGCVPQFYFDNKIYTTANEETNYFYREFFKVEIVENEDILATINRPDIIPHKLEIVVNADKMAEIKAEFSKNFPEFLFTKSAPFMLEVVDKHATKGSAVKYLLSKYNIPPDRAIAIGDGNNDIDMIEVAGFGVAVKNSAHKLQEVADYITTDDNGDGVAEVIDLVLNDKI